MVQPADLAPPLPALLSALPPDVPRVVVRDGRRTIVAVAPTEITEISGASAFDELDALGPGWWAGFLAYDLGRSVERIRAREDADPMPVPDVALGRFDARLCLDPGGAGASPASWLEGEGPGRPLLERALREAGTSPRPEVPELRLGTARSAPGREGYCAGVHAIIDHVEAGDCYQVNLTRQLTWDDAPDPLALYGALADHNPAPHAALVELPGAAVVCASPERFLAWDGPRVETRPIKGTASDAARLRASAKDRAENVMIVDLARNDLGRVCEPGSIRVPRLCELEAHPGLFHLVSTVTGELSGGCGLGALLRATLPPASVTGAPKPRVLQIVEDLEPVRRGPYCGAIGWIDTERGRGDLAVAIRTFTITGGRTRLGVGAGIVADSVPDAEWRETQLKAARLLAAAGARDDSAEARAGVAS